MIIQQRNSKLFLDSSAASYQRNNNSSIQDYTSRETSTFQVVESPEVAGADASSYYGMNESNEKMHIGQGLD